MKRLVVIMWITFWVIAIYLGLNECYTIALIFGGLTIPLSIASRVVTSPEYKRLRRH